MFNPVVTRSDYQALAGVRLAEAKALLDAALWDGAYYLAGYAVETGLKACVIKKVMATDEFLPKKYSSDCYTHNLTELIRLAGLKPSWDADADAAADPVLSGYWGAVNLWSEQRRYERIDETDTRELYEAVADANHGVFQWIKSKW